MHAGRGKERRLPWLPAALAVLGSMGLGGVARAATPAPSVENLRVGFAGNSRNNLFKVGNWTPVWVQLRGGSERFSGTMEVEVPDDDGTPTTFRQPVEVAPGESPRFVAYARPGSREPDVLIRLVDAKGKVVARAVGSQLVQSSAGHTFDMMMPDEALLLTLGKPQGVDLVATLPGYAADRNGGGEVVTVARIDTSSASSSMPGRWYGYDAAQAVVLDTNDREAMQALGVRGQALVDWVSRGGHLVVAVGGNWQSVRDSVLGPILPAVPTGQERLTTLEAIDTFAGSAKNPITPAGSPAVMVAKLEQVDARNGKVLAATGPVPLVVRGAYGFGRVTLIALDADSKPFATWKDRALFWVKAIDLPPPSGDTTGAVQLSGGGRALYRSGVSDLSTQLRHALEQFPGVKLVPFGWVAFFIFLYILLIGPGDYFFLKKVVKRMELTWVTFPLIVLSVSLAAYVAAYAFKGKELRVNKVDVVDIDQASGSQAVARGSSFLNLFSPQNRDYDVSVIPVPLDSPASASPAGENSKSGPPPRPPAGTEVLLSWLGVPEPGFGGMTGARVGFTGSGYSCEPPGGAERLSGVRVPIWSTKCLAARWYGPTAPAAASDLSPVGTDRLNGTVTNSLSIPMNDAILAFGRHVYELGTIPPGASVRVELAKDRQLPGLLKARTATYVPGQEFAARNERINRAELVLALMFHDSQLTAGAERPLPSDPLHYLDLTGQLALDRPMLVARIDHPAARLVLGNAPAEPKVEQTTMLRVILPLSKAPGAAAGNERTEDDMASGTGTKNQESRKSGMTRSVFCVAHGGLRGDLFSSLQRGGGQ